MGNYAGFPILQFYFPLPFLIMALLSYIIPLQIAFKIVTILGTFLLPITIYIMMRLLDFNKKIATIASIFTLPFLFNEANSMWGGNIPSTLAGEFSHSLSLALSVLFLGTLYYALTKKPNSKKWLILNSILFSLVGLSHIYTIFITSISTLPLLLRNFKKRFIYFAIMYPLSFLIMSKWMIPFLLGIPYTTTYNIKWNFNSLSEIYPLILLPFFILGIVGIAYLIFIYTQKNQNPKTKLKIIYFLSPLILSIVFFFIANKIGLVDIRFLIMIYLWMTILSSIAIYHLIKLLNNITSTKGYIKSIMSFSFKYLPILLFLLMTIFIKLNVSYIPHWIDWNYSGFEEKKQYPLYQEITESLKGTIQDPRVIYEHSPKHNNFGTERAFESLPLFSGRNTLEGVYMQSSLSSPFIFYLQSEISEKRSCPFWNNYPCTKVDLEKAAKHLELFNVKHIITISPKVKKEFSEDEKFKLFKKLEQYEIYEFLDNKNKYVVPLENEPILLENINFKDWKKISYEWFTISDLETHLIYSKKPNKEDFKLIKKLDNFNINSTEKIKIQDCKVEENILNEQIKIKTDCINKPVLIKVSYHPNWKVQGADQIYLASPSFMLIFPKQNYVILDFD